MPGRDGTGPIGAGAMTGRGFGGSFAGAGKGMGFGRSMGFGFARGMGRGIGCRRGFGRFFVDYGTDEPLFAASEKEILAEQKKILEAQLDAINKKMQE
ncbi:DUF5320 domain-containing protein [Acidaminobacter sp.]|uniref:DUF5320 domain-containing protein n=1 Tax=Acidaminobacter sp. TaxID=1872102 RepID=UPI0013805C5A|nr:DUF5320 domain-containing protein [Acidaminobacter sp.]MDK9711777.1 DUF5320 domain-containing protein [Acidaminobacter sp.]MZQ97682.1 hypothetical protein [Acidaminobacter sp.]